MNSGATCHMPPYKIDFINDSIKSFKKIVEVADGRSVPVELSGTVMIKTKNDPCEHITLRLIDVLHVPNRERRLFSSMCLMNQNHDVKLSKRNGVQIYLQDERFPISINMS